MVIRDLPAPGEGYGQGTFTQDGCPVDMYAAMPLDVDAAHVVHRAIPPGSSVLELGCGVGRISEPLVALGHEVTGVDSSEAMLVHLVRTRPVLSMIESLDLTERFDAILLASTLINTADAAERNRFLRVAKAHVREGGAVVLERHSPTWRPVEGRQAHLGSVHIQLSDVVWHDRAVLSATIIHRQGGQVARQDFSTRILDDIELDACLISVGFGPARRVSYDGRWMVAEAPEASSDTRSGQPDGDRR